MRICRGTGCRPGAASGRLVALEQATGLPCGRRATLAWPGTTPQGRQLHIKPLARALDRAPDLVEDGAGWALAVEAPRAVEVPQRGLEVAARLVLEQPQLVPRLGVLRL